MIKEQAIVTGLDGNLASIQMQRNSACSHCELNSGCGTGTIGRLLGYRSKPLTIKNNYCLKPGDKVILGMSDHAFLKANLLIYGLPLIGLIGGGLVAQWIFPGAELTGLMFATAGFVAGLSSSGLIANKSTSHLFDAKVLEVDGEPKDRI